MRRVAGLLAAVVVLAACSGGSAHLPTTTGPHLTAAQVAAKLTRLGCNAAPPADPGDPNAVAELSCTIRGEDVTIDEYASASDLATAVGLAKSQGCPLLVQNGTKQFILVEGDNWGASAVSEATARAMAIAIGVGRVVTTTC